MSEVNAFILGVPKAGTTRLAHIIAQHSGVVLAEPKEANVVASHKSTFLRDQQDPEWSTYDDFFSGDGLRVDASAHTFACPLAPARMSSRVPNVRMILCLREPVARTVSHWKMIRDTLEDVRSGVNWKEFATAWDDDRLSADSHYGQSMQRWLEHFSREQFLIIDSQRMKSEPELVLSQVEEFLGLSPHNYDLNPVRHANSASGRRPITNTGRAMRSALALIPPSVRRPISLRLRSMGMNIYRAPFISKKGEQLTVQPEHYEVCGDSLREDLKLFQSLTGFDTSRWIETIESNRKQPC